MWSWSSLWRHSHLCELKRFHLLILCELKIIIILNDAILHHYLTKPILRIVLLLLLYNSYLYWTLLNIMSLNFFIKNKKAKIKRISTTLLPTKLTLISHRLLSRAWHWAGSSSSITYGSLHVSKENKKTFILTTPFSSLFLSSLLSSS